MNSPLIFTGIGIVLIGILLYGIRQYRRFKSREKAHRNLAEKTGLHAAYLNEKNFNIFGSFRTYPIKILPYMIVKQSPAVQFIIPMKNPNQKWIRISKQLDSVAGFNLVSDHENASLIKHQIDTQVHIESNDMIFSSLILSDNVKISIFEAFKGIPSGMLAIDGDSMLFILPSRIKDETIIPQCEKIINLMCDIKDELN